MKGYPQYQFADYEAMHAPLSQGKIVLVYDQIPVERMPGFPCQVGRMMISFCFWEIHLFFFLTLSVLADAAPAVRVQDGLSR